jgi:hypothetical protein
MAAAMTAETVRAPLRAAVDRRSPLVASALDPAQARTRAESALPGTSVETVQVGSVRYRPDGGATVRYRVRFTHPRGEQVLLVDVPASGSAVTVRPFPADPGLPTLPRAVDPVLMRQVLGRVVPGTGGERAIGRCTVDVVHHPRQGRCVLRYRLAQGAGGAGELRHPVLFGKVYADPAAPAAAASALRVLRRGLRSRIDVPEPLALVPTLRLGLAEAIPGRPLLLQLLRTACDAGVPVPDALSDAVAAAARVAAAVHGCGLPATGLSVRDLAGERAATERALAELEPAWPGVAAHLRQRVAHALEVHDGGSAAADGWPAAPVLAHGDLTPGQILLGASGEVGLVDVDTLCVAEPALDLGRFLAYLHVAGIRRSARAWPLLEGLTARFLEAYLDACRPAVIGSGARRLLLARTAAHRALSLARLGAGACWQLKDDRLGATVDVLDAGDDWMRSAAG